MVVRWSKSVEKSEDPGMQLLDPSGAEFRQEAASAYPVASPSG